MRWTDHKTVGLLYGATALGFLLVGFLLMMLMRSQLAWPGQALPSWLAAGLGEANAPGGIMLPEFYDQLVAMHGTVMVFLAVVPLAAGAFANYFIPLQIGAPEMAFPRLNALSYWLYLIAGAIMVGSFFVEGGAANSGWTSYAPLAVIATKGQNYWLIGIFLLGVSSALNAINVLVTIVQGRGPGVSWINLPFFAWSQLVTAVLLLLAFPALQAAAVFQLMDRVAGTSFFLPSGLVVGGVPLQGISGGGNPLLWQHLFLVSASNPVGIDRGDAAGRDDIGLLNVLTLPMYRTVVVQLTSRDVIHSFTLNEMRVKQDANPGMTVRIRFTPTQTGNWEIACSQLCGLGHYRMRGEYRVVTPEAWERWQVEELARLQ